MKTSKHTPTSLTHYPDNVRPVINAEFALTADTGESCSIDDLLNIVVTKSIWGHYNAILTVNDVSFVQGQDSPSVEEAMHGLLDATTELLGFFLKKVCLPWP